MRQVFNVCTSPVVASAWDEGQELNVFGIIYDVKDGIVRRVVGPISGDTGQLSWIRVQGLNPKR